MQWISDQLGGLLRGNLLDTLIDGMVEGVLKKIKKNIDGLKNILIEDIDMMKERVD